MSAVHWLKDNLINFMTGLGTSKDPTQNTVYNLRVMDRTELETVYRSDWIARRIIDAYAEDATREWRAWQAEDKKIEAIERTETKLRIQEKLKLAVVRARLYGGGALVLGVDDGLDPSEPLDLTKCKKDCLKFVVVMNRWELAAGPRIYNVFSEWYTRPEYYTVQTPIFGFGYEQGTTSPGSNAYGATSPSLVKPGEANIQMQAKYGPAVLIHPSRVIELAGNPLPDWRLAPMGGGWGDSVLQTVDEVLRD